MSPRRLQRSLHTHELLRQAALELFSSHGYQSTSLRDLAARLGVQAGSIYNHIENKQSLLFELMEETLDDLLAETRLALKRQSTAQARLRQFVETFLAFQCREQQRLALLERETINLSEEQRKRITRLRNEYARCLGAVIASSPAGLALPDSRMHVLTCGIIGMLQSLPRWSDDNSTPSQDVVNQLTAMITGAITSAKG